MENQKLIINALNDFIDTLPPSTRKRVEASVTSNYKKLVKKRGELIPDEQLSKYIGSDGKPNQEFQNIPSYMQDAVRNRIISKLTKEIKQRGIST